MDNLNQMHVPDQNVPVPKFPLGLFVGACLILVLIVIGIFAFVMRDRITGFLPSAPEEEAIVDQIALMSETMSTAQVLAEDGNRKAAHEALKALYDDTYDPVVKEQTLLAMARNMLHIDIAESVALYMQLIHDETIKPELRAAVIEELGIRFVVGDVSDASLFLDTVFSYEPFNALETPFGTDHDHRIPMLFTYAHSVSPRTVGTAYTAHFYARLLWGVSQGQIKPLELRSEDTAYDTVVAETKATILKNIESAEATLVNIPDSNPYKSLAMVFIESARAFGLAVEAPSAVDTALFTKTLATLEAQRQVYTAFRTESKSTDTTPVDEYIYAADVWDYVLVTTSVLTDVIGAARTKEIASAFLSYLKSDTGSSLRAHLEMNDNEFAHVLGPIVAAEPELATYLTIRFPKQEEDLGDPVEVIE